MGIGRKLQSLSDRVVLRSLRRNMGTVEDSTLGSVEYAAHEAPVRISVTAQGLPSVLVEYAVLHAPCRIGTYEVTLDAGARAIRRTSFATRATFDGRAYAIEPRWYRSAWFVRDGERLALFRRPRGRSRTARWDGAARTEEQALAHALAAYGGIGAPGAILNILGALG